MSACGANRGILAALPRPRSMHLSPRSCCVVARRTALPAVVAVVSALLIHTGNARAQTTSSASQGATLLACDTGWSAPRMLRTPAGQPIYVESPVTVTTKAATYLIGAPTFVWEDSRAFAKEDSKPNIGSPGVRLLNDSTAIPLPPLPSVRKPYMPIAVARGARLLVVWGTSTDTSLVGVFAQDTLWEATLDAGRWSAARPVWTSGSFKWHPGAASYIADDASLTVAFPARRADHGLTVMTRSRDRWRTRWIQVGGAGTNGVTLMRLSESELMLAVVGSIDRGGIRGEDASYVVRVATNDTASLPRFTLLHDVTGMSAQDPSLFRTTDAMHAVWRLGGRAPSPDTLMEATSRDGGLNWTLSSPVSLEGDMRGLRAQQLTGSSALAMATDAGNRSITTLGRSGEGWTITRAAFPDAKTIPMISTTPDRVTVAFGRARSSVGPGDPYDAPVLVTSSRALRCEPTSATSMRKRLRAPPRGKLTLQ